MFKKTITLLNNYDCKIEMGNDDCCEVDDQ